MKNFILLFLLSPLFCIAQLNYKDLTFLAANKIDKNVEYIQSKGYSLREERTTGDGTKQVYYEKGKLSRTMVVMRVLNNQNTVLSYVPENMSNFESIRNDINKAEFQFLESTHSERDDCSSYQSKDYFAKLCEIKFQGSTETSYNITFYRKDVVSQ